MDSAYYFLEKNNLININGYIFSNTLNNGSALSCIYEKENEKVVVKFLICPRNYIELERFKLEYSVLDVNDINSVIYSNSEYVKNKDSAIDGTYPLPTPVIEIYHSEGNFINYFGYRYEEGVLLRDYDATHLTEHEKYSLIHRVASGLSYFNRSGYVHRDLHPGNILLLDKPQMNLWSHYIPRVIILDLGNCQKCNQRPTFPGLEFKRNVDEDAVFKDNNKRLLSSFTSMPPDFLVHGENTLNYDSWSIGIWIYEIIFNEKPFIVNGIEDIHNLWKDGLLPIKTNGNLNKLDIGIQLVLRRLLSFDGRDRPTIHAIVRLFGEILDSDNFLHNYNGYAQKLIDNDGFDLDHRHDE
ncbi:protein kinase domain-containing protein [Rahnella bonaserana]|jgi:serine/threonine protein kinase|uniref:protein kinase domain-containing protein n=1 Tax=Rahnella bonaserana TaxID=2816248 RepID=UPI0032082E33